MQKVERAGEPTMEEILASIRQIISEEPSGSRPNIPAPPPHGPGTSPATTLAAPAPAAASAPSATPRTTAGEAAQEPRLAPRSPAPATSPAVKASNGGETEPMPLAKLSGDLPTALRPSDTPRSPSTGPTPLLQPAVPGPVDKPVAGTGDFGMFVPRRADERPASPPSHRDANVRQFNLQPEPLSNPAPVSPAPLGRREPADPTGDRSQPALARLPGVNGSAHGAVPSTPFPAPHAVPAAAPNSAATARPAATPSAPAQPQQQGATGVASSGAPAKGVVAMVPPATREDAKLARPDAAPASASPSAIDQLLAARPSPVPASPPAVAATAAPPTVPASVAVSAPPATAPAAQSAAGAASREAPASSAVVPLPPIPQTEFRKPTVPAVRQETQVSPVQRDATELTPVGQAPVKTLEDTVVDLLRPMLRTWLDENMPRIVEKALRVELSEQLKSTALPKRE